jgi:serine/threonine-protein kinase 24/25/MST4
MSRTPTVHQLYQRLETVGRGAYCSVHKGIHIPSGNVVALKIINLDTEDDDVGDIQREVALLTQLRDAPNVTKYYGCYLDGPRVWIVMEFAQGGSVRTLMKACKDSIVEEKYIVVIVREVLMGLGYLHRSAIIHRDVKAANILITAAGKVMICDFGVSALLATTSSKRNTFIGTPYWMAPEVAQPVPAYDTKADIWSLGILIYEMAKGSPPHSNLEATKVLQLIPRTKAPRLIEGEGSKDMRDFVACCLRESSHEVSPIPSRSMKSLTSQQRLPPDELLRTKWIKSASRTPVSILKDLLLRYDAWSQSGGTRTSIADLLPWEEEESE